MPNWLTEMDDPDWAVNVQDVQRWSPGSCQWWIQTFGWGGINLICFPVSHVYFFVGGGPKSIAKLDGGAMARFSPTWICHCFLHLLSWHRLWANCGHNIRDFGLIYLFFAFPSYFWRWCIYTTCFRLCTQSQCRRHNFPLKPSFPRKPHTRELLDNARSKIDMDPTFF